MGFLPPPLWRAFFDIRLSPARSPSTTTASWEGETALKHGKNKQNNCRKEKTKSQQTNMEKTEKKPAEITARWPSFLCLRRVVGPPLSPTKAFHPSGAFHAWPRGKKSTLSPPKKGEPQNLWSSWDVTSKRVNKCLIRTFWLQVTKPNIN